MTNRIAAKQKRDLIDKTLYQLSQGIDKQNNQESINT